MCTLVKEYINQHIKRIDQEIYKINESRGKKQWLSRKKKTEHLKIRFRLIKLVQNTKVKQVAGRGFYAKKMLLAHLVI